MQNTATFSRVIVGLVRTLSYFPRLTIQLTTHTGKLISCRAQYTFAATRNLRLLMFDGFSAAKQPDGKLDLQDILAYGAVKNSPMMDYERVRPLCEWAKKFDIDGFVREEATF